MKTHDHDHDHKNDHAHSHSHSHLEGGTGRQSRAFAFGLAITAVFVVVEFVAGFWFNSLALISDAGHNLTDALALGFGLVALRLARRAPDASKTYGYHRAGILAATLNATTLVLISLYIFYEGAQRLLNPPPVEGWAVVGVAGIALLVNLGVAALLLGSAKDDLNSRSVFLHIATDAVASLGVIGAGLVEGLTGWRQIDPLISILIGLLIIWSSWGIIKEATNILLEGIPAGLHVEDIRQDVLEQPGVSAVHDLHVWTIGSGYRALSCHVQMDDTTTLAEANRTVQGVVALLEERYDIRHATVQAECQSCEAPNDYCVKSPADAH